MKNWLAKLKPSAGSSTPEAATADPAAADPAADPTAAPPSDDGGERSPKSAPVRAARSSRVRSRGSLAPVLGLYVTPQTIYGLLLRREGDGFEVVRRVTRKRAAGTEEVMNNPEELLADADLGDDIAIQFGEAGINTGSDMFIGSEFGAFGDVSDAEYEGDGLPATATAQPIVLELKDLIEECQSGSLESPRLAFCLDASDVAYAELRVENAPKSKGLFNFSKDDKGDTEEATEADAPQPASAVKHEALIELLPDPLKAAAHDPERVAFLPMTPRDGAARFLAVVPEVSEPVTPSVSMLREQDGMRNVRMALLSAEIPALMGLTRQVFPLAEGNTAIVRVGAEDTLVMLLVGDTLHHAEHMRSVTTFDGPDTICSRVLLQQDVQGVGNVDQVIVLAEEREEELVNGFAAFYPDAYVTTLRTGLVEGGWLGSKAATQRPLSSMLIPATSVALDAFHRGDDTGFTGVNLFPKSVLRQKMKFEWLSNFGFAWHTVLAAVVVFLTVLFFTSLFFKNEAKKSDIESVIATYPAASLSPEQVQFRIDSLNAEVARVNATLSALDSLLVGSDRWSRGLARTARAVASARQGWVESWSEEGSQLVLTGRAVSRQGVVQFADRMGGSIESVRFSEVRDYPAYDFEIRSRLTNEMPEVAVYLRQNAQGFEPAEPVPVEDPLSDYEEATPPTAATVPAGAVAATPEAAAQPSATAAPEAAAQPSAEALFRQEDPPEGFVVPELALAD